MIIVISCSVAGAALLALLGLRYVLNDVSRDESADASSPSVSIIIPSLGGGRRLAACLNALNSNMPPGARKVIVVLQQSAEPTAYDIRPDWTGSVELKVCEMDGNPSKSSAITLALRFVETEWVLLLDSDTRANSHLHKLFNSLATVDAAYGMILPVEQQTHTFLDRVVKADKVVSHGVWRLGRFAAGLWPNLPGQCYAIRTSLLCATYDGAMGHLDDLAVTLNLAAHRCRVRFVPAVVCFEEGRATWFGLLSQRARWTIGLVQSLGKVPLTADDRLSAVICWTIHAWLYFGWPLFSAGISFTLLALRCPFWAMIVAISFLLTWSLLTLIGNRVFSHIHPDFVPVKYGAAAFPASCLIMLAQVFGLVAAPGFLLAQAIKPLFGNQMLYRR